jgi:CTD small phosphatase-like protein 2
MIIIDNCVGSFGNQIPNGIPILPFTGDRQDRELPQLAAYIRKLATAGDRLLEVNAAAFGLGSIRFCKDASHYVKSLPSN